MSECLNRIYFGIGSKSRFGKEAGGKQTEPQETLRLPGYPPSGLWWDLND